MADPAEAEAADEPTVEPACEGHRRRDRAEHPADGLGALKGVEDDLLDRRDISDQTGENCGLRKRVAERLAFGENASGGGVEFARLERPAKFLVERLGQAEETP